MMGKQVNRVNSNMMNMMNMPPKFQKPVFGFNSLPVATPVPVVQQPTTYANPQQLKENINTFLNLDRDK